jgi:hypothetical protein
MNICEEYEMKDIRDTVKPTLQEMVKNSSRQIFRMIFLSPKPTKKATHCAVVVVKTRCKCGCASVWLFM